MSYPVTEWMLIGIIFLSFMWGMLFGIKWSRRRFVERAMKVLPIDEVKKLVGDNSGSK